MVILMILVMVDIYKIALTLLVLLCVTACSNEEIVDDEEIIPVPTRTMMLKAMMPGEETKNSGPLTRLSLTETDEGTISVKWRVGDKINLCFVSNEGNVVRTSSNIEVTNISDNGKQAVFEISILMILPERLIYSAFMEQRLYL